MIEFLMNVTAHDWTHVVYSTCMLTMAGIVWYIQGKYFDMLDLNTELYQDSVSDKLALTISEEDLVTANKKINTLEKANEDSKKPSAERTAPTTKRKSKSNN